MGNHADDVIAGEIHFGEVETDLIPHLLDEIGAAVAVGTPFDGFAKGGAAAVYPKRTCGAEKEEKGEEEERNGSFDRHWFTQRIS